MFECVHVCERERKRDGERERERKKENDDRVVCISVYAHWIRARSGDGGVVVSLCL